MKKSTKKLLLSSLIAVSLAACGGDSGDATSSSNNGYTADETKVAIEQCSQSGLSTEMCECVTKEIQQKISSDEMKKFEADMAASETINEEFAKLSSEAGIKCMQAQN